MTSKSRNGLVLGVPEANLDKQADELIDRSLESFWSKWLPGFVKAVVLLLICCCCGILAVLLQHRQQPKAGHQS